MQYFQKIAEGIGVAPVMAQLNEHLELWDQHPFRTRLGPDGPFDRTSDIWIRWRPLNDLKEPKDFNAPHFAVFYPAWENLPALHGVVFAIMAAVRATHLGAILITRVPPGVSIKPHNDRGGWNAETMDTKVYLTIKTNPYVETYCEDERIVMREGDVWAFNNLVTHGLDNRGETERVSAIITMRTF